MTSNAEAPPIAFWDAHEALRGHEPCLLIDRAGRASFICSCGGEDGRGFVLHLLDQMYADRLREPEETS